MPWLFTGKEHYSQMVDALKFGGRYVNLDSVQGPVETPASEEPFSDSEIQFSHFGPVDHLELGPQLLELLDELTKADTES